MSYGFMLASARTTRRRAIPGGRGGSFVFMTEINSRLGQVVGGHLDRNPVARQNADSVLLHASRRVGEHFVPTFQGNAEPGIGQNFAYDAFKFDQIFFSQVFFPDAPVDRRKPS